MTLKDKL